MMHSKMARVSPLIVLALVAGCGGGGGSDSSPSTSANAATSSSSASGCNYADKVTATERSQASQCGIQVSANFAQADSGLAEVIAACKLGEVSKANAYYAGTYQQMVDYARSVAKSLSCTGSTTSTLPNTSTQTYYNFCVTNSSVTSTPLYKGSCYGPVKQGDGGCGSGNYISQYSSSAACNTGGTAWLKSH